MDHLTHRVEDLTLDKQRAGQLEADLKQAKTAHDKALAAVQQSHQQQVEEALAARQQALKEAKANHQQAVEVGLTASFVCTMSLLVETFVAMPWSFGLCLHQFRNTAQLSAVCLHTKCQHTCSVQM